MALLLLLGTTVIVLATFTDASMKLLSLIGKRPAIVDVSGRWTTGKITGIEKYESVKLLFDFWVQGDMLRGFVQETWVGYQGTYRILDGVIKNNSISFRTEHDLFRTGSRNGGLGTYTIKIGSYHKLYRGTTSRDEINFTIQVAGLRGVSPTAEFVAKRE